MKNKMLFVVSFFLVCFVIGVVFLVRNKNSKDGNVSNNKSGKEYVRIFGQVEFIGSDHIGVVLVEKRQEDGTGVYVSGKDFKQVDLNVNGDTPVFIFNNETKEENVSQMAGLEWRDYAVIQYDETTKEVKKILILRDEDSIMREIKS